MSKVSELEDELHTAREERERVNSELQLSIKHSSSLKEVCEYMYISNTVELVLQCLCVKINFNTRPFTCMYSVLAIYSVIPL